MSKLSESVQVSPIPNKDKTLLVITAMFSKTIFYEVGLLSFYRIDSLDIEKFCKFINAVNQKYGTSYIYEPSMYYGEYISQFIDVTDEDNYIKTELTSIGQTLMNKFISKLPLDDNGAIPVHQSVCYSLFRDNNYQFDYTKWTYNPSTGLYVDDTFIIIYATIHPFDINWSQSIMNAIYKPEIKSIITINPINEITGIHTNEYSY